MDADPIIEEVRRIRREYAERFGYDLRAVAADLRKREQQHPGRLVSFPPKPFREKRTAERSRWARSRRSASRRGSARLRSRPNATLFSSRS